MACLSIILIIIIIINIAVVVVVVIIIIIVMFKIMLMALDGRGVCLVQVIRQSSSVGGLGGHAIVHHHLHDHDHDQHDEGDVRLIEDDDDDCTDGSALMCAARTTQRVRSQPGSPLRVCNNCISYQLYFVPIVFRSNCILY